jgi:hypothetical protein
MVVIRTSYINSKTLSIVPTQCIYLFLIIAINSNIPWTGLADLFFHGDSERFCEVRTEYFNIQMKQQVSTSDSLILVRERRPITTKMEMSRREVKSGHESRIGFDTLTDWRPSVVTWLWLWLEVNTYPNGPVVGHFNAGFHGFPSVFKQILR